MTPVTDTNELGDARLPSYGIRRILAAVADDPELEGAHVTHDRLWAARMCGPTSRRSPAIEPDLIGFSIYVWSTPCMVEVAREVKRRLPELHHRLRWSVRPHGAL